MGSLSELIGWPSYDIYCCLVYLHFAIHSTFIKLPFVIKIFVLSIFEWQFYTGFTVYPGLSLSSNLKNSLFLFRLTI